MANDKQLPAEQAKRRTLQQRVFRWALRGSIAVMVLAVIACAIYGGMWFYNSSAGKERLAKVTAELDAKEPGWRMADAIRIHNEQLPPDDDNIAVLALRIDKELQKLAPQWDKSDFDSLSLDNRDQNEALDMDDMVDLIDLVRPWKSLTDQLAPLQHHIRGGLPLKDIGNPMQMDFGGLLQLRRVSTLFQLLSTEAAARGDGHQAIAYAHANLNVARTINGPGGAILYLVRFAGVMVSNRTIAQALAWCKNLDERELAALQNLYMQEANEAIWERILKSERAFGHRMLESLISGALMPDEVIGATSQDADERLRWIDYQQYMHDDLVSLLDWYRDALANPNSPPPPAGRLPDGKFDTNRKFSDMHALVIAGLHSTTLRHRAACLTTAAALAAERYRIKNGRWPSKRDEWQTVIDFDKLIDPYDKQPLRMKAMPDGLIIYSVGKDNKDDGGEIDLANPKGGKDEGVRLWNLKHRRVPQAIKRIEPEIDGP